MMYIRKRPASSEVSQEIQRVKRDVNWDHTDHRDPEIARIAFDMLDKKILRKQLISEQKGLCAYCMRRIFDDESTTIEHWLPIQESCESALQYENMMACCDGGRRNDNRPRILTCDAAKGSQAITVNPYNKGQMDKVCFRRTGQIHIDHDENLQKDINEILHLNGKVNSSGKTEQDTATHLVHSRQQVYERYVQFINGLVRDHKPVETAVKKRIAMISNSTEMDEFAGVWLYFLNRKLKRI